VITQCARLIIPTCSYFGTIGSITHHRGFLDAGGSCMIVASIHRHGRLCRSARPRYSTNISNSARTSSEPN
jgi:hypothetical protein